MGDYGGLVVLRGEVVALHGELGTKDIRSYDFITQMGGLAFRSIVALQGQQGILRV